jgi:UDP-glucuronate 4-epimerase
MRILVTGGAGFIAFHLASRLMADGHSIFLLDNFNSFYDPALKRKNIRDLQALGPAPLFEMDILDFPRLKDVFSQVRPDSVVHLAAWAGVRPSLENPILYSEVNVTGTVHMLELAKLFRTERFIFASSSSVYGGNTKLPFSESDPVEHPVSPYAATKKAGELLCHTYSANHGMHTTCLRFFTVYGPRQRPEMAIHKFAKALWEGKPIPMFGDGDTRRDYTYVDDIVTGIVAALRANPRYEVFNLGESQTTTLRELISLLEAALGKKADIQQLPLQVGDVEATYADIDKAKRMLGYNPSTPITTGIRKFAEWFAAENA